MSTRTLLLSAWYLPVRVLRWQDAAKMIYLGSVDVIAEYAEELRSPSIVWKMPAVVRLRRDVRTPDRSIRFSRLNVFRRDRFTCQYCGKSFRHSELTCDHIVPRSRGGRTSFENIVAACTPCNARKADQTCDQSGMFPLTEPRHPKILPPLPRVMESRCWPPEWQPFLTPSGA